VTDDPDPKPDSLSRLLVTPIIKLDGLARYLNAAVGLRENAFNDAIQRLCRWWLEFARNVLVVGGFLYIAVRSGDTALIIFAWISLGVLNIYMLSLFGG
jgi:hypothetical protein